MKQYSSQAQIRVTRNSLLVRFKKVGAKPRFDLIRKDWQTTFPQSYWNNKCRAWELPLANLEDVQKYCQKMFWQVKIEKLPPHHFLQPSLF